MLGKKMKHLLFCRAVMCNKLSPNSPIRVFLLIVVISIIVISIIQIRNKKQCLSRWAIYTNISIKTTNSNVSRHDYYICAQVWNETNEHMIEWIEHQIFRLGFRNVCMISVEQPLDRTLVKRYRLATITKMVRVQEWQYCLECFTDPPMKPQDLLMVQVNEKPKSMQRKSPTYDRN
jgi:hypothetical protein